MGNSIAMNLGILTLLGWRSMLGLLLALQKKPGKIGMGRLVIIFIVIVLSILPVFSEGQAQESWLIVEPVHGDFGLSQERFQSDNSAGSSHFGRDYYFLYEEVNLRNRISIYDPRFIELNLGAGLKLGQGGGDADEENNQITRYNLSANFLKKHPYSLNLDYSKYTSEYEHSPTSFTILDRKESGGTVRLQEKIGLPIPLILGYRSVHQQSDSFFNVPYAGNTFDQQVFRFDENTKSYDVSSTKAWEQVSLNWHFHSEDVNRFQFYNGIPVIIEYRATQLNANLAGTAGEKKRLRWYVNWSDRDRTDSPRYAQTDFNTDLNFRIYDFHSNSLDSAVGFGRSLLEQGGGSDSLVSGEEVRLTETKRARGGLTHRLFQSLHSQVNLRQEQTVYPDYERIVKESFLSTRYTKKITDGRVYGGYSLTTRKEENTGSLNLLVIDEIHTLTNFDPVTLNSINIVLSSVVVTDETGTITYLEGPDYRIYQTGQSTFIERVSGTSILNGETVLVTYDYLNARGDRLDRTRVYDAGVHWWFMEPYVRVTVRREEISDASQDEAALLNSGRSDIHGLKLRQLLWNRVLPSWSIEKERNTALQDSFLRTSTSAGLTVNVFIGVTVTFFSDRGFVQYKPPERFSDVETRGANMQYARGRIVASLDTRKTDSQIVGTDRVVRESKGTLTYRLGQWTLDTSLRKANERWVYSSDPTLEFESDYYESKVSVKRNF